MAYDGTLVFDTELNADDVMRCLDELTLRRQLGYE